MGNFTDTERRCIIDELLRRSVKAVLDRGEFAALADNLGCHRSTIRAIWQQYDEAMAAGDVANAWKSRKKGNCGRKSLDPCEVKAKVAGVPVKDRQVLRKTAVSAGVSVHQLNELLKSGELKRRSGRIKPSLTQENKLQRVEWALSFVNEKTREFELLDDIVMVDEKWFNADKDARTFMIFEDEEVPSRRCRSKNFIPKTMFLAAVARPRFDPHRKSQWDGKLGIWPFTEKYEAKKKSRYSPRGTVCTKNIETVDRAVYKLYLLRYVIPAINLNWPRGWDRRRPIFIQQDNAKPHVPPHDPDIVAAGTADGWNIRLIFQPANSPDLNCLDLGLFASLQSLQYDMPCNGVDELVFAVEEAFRLMRTGTLNSIFLTLQKCMECIMQEDGDNTYKLPHMGKAKLLAAGKLPKTWECDAKAFDQAVSFLKMYKRGSLLFFGLS